MSAWRDQARTAEGLGYSTLYISDHLDAQFGPLVATTVAAEATSTLHIGPFVLNNDLRHPVVLAKEIATLGLAAEGRVGPVSLVYSPADRRVPDPHGP